MRLARAAALFACLGAGAPDAAERRYVTAAEAPGWSGVGLLHRRGGGSCTAFLIRPDTVLTAAHCVADADTRRVAAPADLVFRAGVAEGRAAAERQVVKVTPHPGYFVASSRYDQRRVRVDVAKATLESPISAVPAYRIGATPPAGAEVALISYPGGRRARASIQEPCRIARRETEFLLLDCLSEPGASGSPYFLSGAGEATVVGVNSGTRHIGDRRYALALGFAHLRDFIGPSGGALAPGGPARVRRGGGLLPGGSVAGEGLGRLRR